MSRVLVTGGASGLGLALVRQFVAEGHQVLSTDVHADATAPDGAQYLQLNVRSADDWAAAAASVPEATASSAAMNRSRWNQVTTPPLREVSHGRRPELGVKTIPVTQEGGIGIPVDPGRRTS